MFDSRNKVEGYIFDEKDEAYSNEENRKNYLKEEITAKFIQFSKKGTCQSVKKEVEEYKTRYIAKFLDRIPLSIVIYNNTLEINKDIVTCLDKCVKEKEDKKIRKIQIRNKILVASLSGSITLSALFLTPKMVKLDNKQFNDDIGTRSEQLYDEQQRYINHQNAVELRRQENIEHQKQVEEQSSELQNYMEEQQEKYEQEQQRLLEESREYDLNNEKTR